jgi:5-formyltetrahydrofolate cyclo-ligase
MKDRRRVLSQHQRTLFSRRIAERVLKLRVRRATVVFIYLSCNDEVATHSVVDQPLFEGKVVLVPKIVSSTEMAACRFPGWDKLIKGLLGILYPSDWNMHCAPVNVAMTPALAFSMAGARLGFGAGYYDRWFASHQVNIKIGLSFEAQLLAALPSDQNNVPMDIIVTEKRSIRISRTKFM